MLRIFLAILFLLTGGLAQAQEMYAGLSGPMKAMAGVTPVAAPASGGKSCAVNSIVLFDSSGNSNDNSVPVGVNNGYYWTGQKGVQFSAATVICEVSYVVLGVLNSGATLYSEAAAMSGTSWGTAAGDCASAGQLVNSAGTKVFSHSGGGCVVPASTNWAFALTARGINASNYVNISMSYNMTPTTSTAVVGNGADWNNTKTIDDNRTTLIQRMVIKGYAQ